MIKLLKNILHVIIFAIFISCGNNNGDEEIVRADSNNTNLTDTNALIDEEIVEDTTDYDYATYYVVFADTGYNYFALQAKMYQLSKSANIEVDTLGRFYNQKKNLIALPDNDEDEIYAGEYFPRRFPSETLSLEYFNFYDSQSAKNLIALVTGIYEDETSADSALKQLKNYEQKAFSIKSEIYIGCMH